mgnify:CR=1 FL=1|tara:strand:- start:118 stop:1002 length:885 start_codon:yes stop_codon:yes gene_type:complete
MILENIYSGLSLNLVIITLYIIAKAKRRKHCMKQEILDTFLSIKNVEKIFNIFAKENIEIRLVGGCIRDYLLNAESKDIDFAVNCHPKELIQILNKNKITYNDYAIKYGSVAINSSEMNFELTSLREDTNQKGRQTEVKFTNDWQKDALRRDFTMNALYLSSSGSFYDYFNGEKDITNNQVKFIGKIDKRIQEDYLRIFRYYRFLGCFKYLNIIEGYQESLIKHIPQIKKYIKFEIMRNEILKMLKNKYAINSLRDFNRIGKKNELIDTVNNWWLEDNYFIGLEKCMNKVNSFF